MTKRPKYVHPIAAKAALAAARKIVPRGCDAEGKRTLRLSRAQFARLAGKYGLRVLNAGAELEREEIAK